MMKKKNMAIAMAAVTVASSVAPVFAAEKDYTTTTEDSAKIVSKVRELLKQKYTEDESTSQIEAVAIYTVKVDKEIRDGKVVDGNTDITNATELSNILSKLEKGQEAVITITDKGHATVDGKVVNKTVPEYTTKDLVELEKTIPAATLGFLKAEFDNSKDALVISLGTKEVPAVPAVAYVAPTALVKDAADNAVDVSKIVDNNQDGIYDVDTNEDGTVTTVEANTVGVVLTKDATYTKGKKAVAEVPKKDAKVTGTLTLKKGSKQLDFTKPIHKAGTAEGAGTAETVVGYQTKVATEIAPTTQKITVKNSKEVALKVDTLFDGIRFTQDGMKLIDELKAIVKDGDPVQDGDQKIYDVAVNNVKEVETTTTKTGKKYEFNIELSKKVGGDVVSTMTMDGTDKKALEKVRNAFHAELEGAGYAVKVLSGDNRFETAAKLSKDKFETGTETNSIVLVSANAIADGLAAAPLAAAVNAPVLLTNVENTPESTLSEIERLIVDDNKVSELKNKTIYLVGGETVISKSVESKLANLGVTVERIAGANRSATSLEIAEKIKDLEYSKKLPAGVNVNSKKAYVVGGLGEADAMSIASVAANKTDITPILLSDAKDMSDEMTQWLKNENKRNKITQTYVVGGTTKISDAVVSEVKEALKDSKVERIAGDNRYETNAEVINKLYKSEAGKETLYVAKGEDKNLVDALAAGAIANGQAVLLTKDDLTTSQQEVVDIKGYSKITQVGGLVTKTVVEKIGKLFNI